MLTYFSPSDINKLFTTDSQHAALVNTLINMKSPPTLKASAIQTCSYLIAQEGVSFGEKQRELIDGTFELALDRANTNNIAIQLRASQACKDFVVFLMRSNSDGIPAYKLPEFKARTSWLLYLMLNCAVSQKEKIVSSAVRALGFFLQEIDLEYLQKEVLDVINSGQHPDLPKTTDFSG